MNQNDAAMLVRETSRVIFSIYDNKLPPSKQAAMMPTFHDFRLSRVGFKAVARPEVDHHGEQVNPLAKWKRQISQSNRKLAAATRCTLV